MKVTYHKWQVEEPELADMTPAKARDLVIKCFFEAQKESIARGKKALGMDVSDASIMTSVRTAIQMAFCEAGGDFEAPDKESLTRVVQLLADKARAWGTPPAVIAHHKNQMEKIFQRLG